MTATKINARGWTFEIQDNATTPAYVEIGGLTEFTISRSSKDVETTDFDSNGNSEGEKMERGKSITCKGFYKEDASNQDAGQAEVEEVADAKGTTSLRNFRITSPGGDITIWSAHFEIGDVGGGNNDKTSWGFTAVRSGADS
jgi:hypothetical protein